MIWDLLFALWGIVKKKLNKRILELQERLINQAEEPSNLILEIDGFAIRKGHRYNTGFQWPTKWGFIKCDQR